MSTRRGQSFLHGALILSAAAILVKVIGAVFKIPLTIVLGGEGAAYFYTAYDIFNPVSAMAIAGLPVAISKLVAESVACGRYKDARCVRRISLCLFCATGVIGFLVTLLFARKFAELVGNCGGFMSIAAISPAILFLCLMSSYRGYYEGLRNMYPTAVSQVAEALVKLVLGFTFSLLILKRGLNEFLTTGYLLGVKMYSLSEARVALLPYAAAGAVLGVTISTLVGLIYVAARHRLKGDGISEQELNLSPPPQSKRAILGQLVKIAVPVCLGAMVVNLTSLIDLVSIMNRLNAAVQSDPVAIMKMYAGMLPVDMSLSRLPRFLFGTYKGLPMTLFNVVPAITTTFGISALPAVASAWAGGRKQELYKNISAALRVTSLIAMPAGIGIMALAGPILTLLYNFSGSGLASEVAISTPLLAFMGISVIFVAITGPVNAMLQAVGRADLPVKYMLVGGTLKLISNFILVAIPGINIMGAPVGTLCCYLFIVVASLISLSKITKVKPDYISILVKPLVSALLCGGAAYAAYGFISRFIDHRLSTVLAILTAAFVYVISLILLRGVNKDDLNMLPCTEKIAKGLEKRGLIG